MIDLTVKTLDSRNHNFSLEDNVTVRQFKEQIAESVAVPADSQRLIYCGRVLQDEKKLVDYDVHGKVIHLVQRAPPQSSHRGNSTGLGQDQGQSHGQGQGQVGNSHRQPFFRHARGQVHFPGIDGNAMYLGAMSFPGDAEGQANPRGQPCTRETVLFSVAQKMLGQAGSTMRQLDQLSSQSNTNQNSASTSSQEPQQEQRLEQEQSQEERQDQHQEPELELEQEQEPEQELEPDNEFEHDHDEGSFEIEGGTTGGGGLAQAASAAINAALSAAGLSTAALSSLTLLGGQSDGSNPTVIHAHIQRNNAELGESTTASNSNDISQSEHSQSVEPQQPTSSQPQGQEDVQQQQQQSTPADSPNVHSERRQHSEIAGSPRNQLIRLISAISHSHDRLRPYLQRYQSILASNFSERTAEENREVQRIADGVSESLHYLAHAAHALSDVIVDVSQPPPANIRYRPLLVQHSALLQAGIPIQVEAHISLHGRNQNMNNNNENGTTPTPSADGAPASVDSGENGASTNETEGNQNTLQQSETTNRQEQQQQQPQPPQQQQQQQQQHQQQQQQQQTFGTMFNVPHNVEVLMEMGPEVGGSEQAQQSLRNRNNNNNGNPGGINAGIFPWGVSPPPEFMRSLMQAVVGQMARGVATATTVNAATPPTGESASNADGTSTTVPPATVEGSNSNPAQSTQARGNTGTHPTTSTQTRSTPRPHVFHSNTHQFGLGMRQGRSFDPLLPCNSHHVRRNLPTAARPNATAGQRQQANQTLAATSQSQNAPWSASVNTTTPTRETSSTDTRNATPAPQSQTNSMLLGNLLTRFFSGAGGQSGQIQTGPGGWMQLFTEEIPNVQGLLANSSNQAGSGMTLMDLLENTPGLGVSTNIGIIGPLRTDRAPQGEDLLFELVVTLVQNITLEGWEALRTGHWEPLAGVRRPVREFFQNFFGSTSLSGSEERVVDRLIIELQPTLNQLLIEDTNARDGPEMRVDIPATIESLLRRHFLNILRLLFENDVDDTRFAQGLMASIKTLQTEACSVLQYSFRGRQLRIETVTQRVITRLTEGVEPSIRQWIVNSCVLHVCSYLARMTQLPDNEVVPLLVLRNTPGPIPTPAPVVQQRTVPPTQPEPEPMETDPVEERVEAESLGAEGDETFPGHEAVPSDWVPIIARDGIRQRRQLQVQMQSQGMAGSGVGGFSDAYLGGMPSKRRKLIEQQKPRILLSPTPNHSVVSISMERLVRDSVVRAGIEEVDGAAAAVATDAGVRRAFGQAIRGCLHQHPQRQTTPDFPDPLRFPNATKYFAKHDETTEK
ncbi:large proline-rich protein BAG6 [Neodiprion fabricii]|uniref:large proline-rich protein BAG6 n=1 Tax=Neodiprion fabricii TaxID=2872261 RepID=UPI001ED94B74|nr:large proline-rich protein BAG6 [Neodiprion fabricii]